MKNVLILNGAPNKTGMTAAMIRAFSEAAKAAGNEVRELYLQGMEIHGCLDCQGCARAENGCPNPCVQKDDMAQVYEEFRKADVIVFASPVYWWTITGTLKTTIDRLYALYRKPGNGGGRKESVLLMTSGGTGLGMINAWYSGFEQMMGWTNLGAVMNNMDAAKRIGASIR